MVHESRGLGYSIIMIEALRAGLAGDFARQKAGIALDPACTGTALYNYMNLLGKDAKVTS